MKNERENDGQTDKWIYRHMGVRTDRWVYDKRQITLNRVRHGQTDRRTAGWLAD